MIDIIFEINGREVQPGQVGNEHEEAALNTLKREILNKVGDIHDPQTGEHLKVLVKGRDLSDLTLEVSGSDHLVERAIKALQ